MDNFPTDILEACSSEIVNLGNGKSNKLLANVVSFFSGNNSDQIKGYDVVLLGLDSSANNVRHELYKLYFHGRNLNIIDLGNLKNSADINTILLFLSKQNKFTILLSESSNWVTNCFDALCAKMDSVTVSSVLHSFDLNSGYLGDLYRNRNHKLFDFNILAYQLYLTSPDSIIQMNNSYYKAIRLGDIRRNLKDSEPFLRDTNLLSVDLSAVRQSDSLLEKSGPNGLYAEELCRLLGISGFSDNMKIVYLFGYNSPISQTLTAEAVWHLLEGYLNRRNEVLLNNVNGIKKILVNLDSPPCRLVFYHSPRSERWWMEVDNPASSMPYIIACSDKDYREACKHEIPLRWVWYRQKLIGKFKTS